MDDVLHEGRLTTDERTRGRGEMDEGRRTREKGRGKMDEKRTKKIKSVRDLKVYRKAFDSAMEIFEITKKFPKEETYYINEETFHRLDENYEHIFAMLHSMEKKADAFCRPAS